MADTLLRTASSAHCAFRPRRSASDLMYAAASFSTLRFISSSMGPPPSATGCAAPMFVPGAIAAR